MKNNRDEIKIYFEQKIEEQKEEIKKFQNESKDKNKCFLIKKDIKDKLSHDLSILKKKNIQYENIINSYKIENLHLKKIILEKEKIIKNFQKVASEAKKRIETLFAENKKLMEENKLINQQLENYKSTAEINQDKEMLNKLQSLKNELNQIENYYITQLNEKKEKENQEIKIEKEDDNKKNNNNISLTKRNTNLSYNIESKTLESNPLKQSMSSLIINTKKFDNKKKEQLTDRVLNTNISIGNNSNNNNNRKKCISSKRRHFLNLDAYNNCIHINKNNGFHNNIVTNILFSNNGRNKFLKDNHSLSNISNGNIYYNPIKTNNFINRKNQFSPFDTPNKTSEIYEKYFYN